MKNLGFSRQSLCNLSNLVFSQFPGWNNNSLTVKKIPLMLRYACPLVSLQYSVLDPDTLKRLHRSKKQQIEMERLANKVNVVANFIFHIFQLC